MTSATITCQSLKYMQYVFFSKAKNNCLPPDDVMRLCSTVLKPRYPRLIVFISMPILPLQDSHLCFMTHDQAELGENKSMRFVLLLKNKPLSNDNCIFTNFVYFPLPLRWHHIFTLWIWSIHLND